MQQHFGIYKEIGKRINLRREQLGLPVSYMTKELAMTPMEYAAVELGSRRYQVHTMEQIAVALKMNPGDLFGLRIEPTSPAEIVSRKLRSVFYGIASKFSNR